MFFHFWIIPVAPGFNFIFIPLGNFLRSIDPSQDFKINDHPKRTVINNFNNSDEATAQKQIVDTTERC